MRICIYCMPLYLCIYASANPSICLISERSARSTFGGIFGAREHKLRKSQCCQNGITTSDKHDTQLSIDISRLFPLCCTRLFQSSNSNLNEWMSMQLFDLCQNSNDPNELHPFYDFYFHFFFLFGLYGMLLRCCLARFLSLIRGLVNKCQHCEISISHRNNLDIANCHCYRYRLASIGGLTSLLGQKEQLAVGNRLE